MGIFYKEAGIDNNDAKEVNLRTSLGTELLGQNLSNLSIPVVVASDQYSPLIKINGAIPQQSQLLASSIRVLMLSGTVPVGKKWLITDWDGSGEGKGLFQLFEVSDIPTTQILLDGFESIANITKGNAITSFALTSALKTQGSFSIVSLMNFSGAGNQTGKLVKTYSPVLDLSIYDSLVIDCQSVFVNSMISLKLFQGASTYQFSAQTIGLNNWSTISFDLGEITTFNLTAIDKIEIWFYETDNGKADGNIWIDNLRGQYGTLKIPVDVFYSNGYVPHQRLFPNNYLLTEGKSLQIYITNKDTAAYNFTTGFMGIEI